MLYTEFKVKDKEYKLRMNARACVDLEKKLGLNPLNVLAEAADGKIPSLEDMLAILHASMQCYLHGIKIDDVYEIYDEFIDDEHVLVDLIPVIVDIFKVSGFFKEGDADSKNSKKRAVK